MIICIVSYAGGNRPRKPPHLLAFYPRCPDSRNQFV